MQNATKTLLEAWKKLDTKNPPFILPGDEEIIEHQQYYKNYDDFIRNENFGFSSSTKFHTGLLPSPFSGNILTAKIFILALNPGFSTRDYYEETYNQEIIKKRKLRLKNIFSEVDYPWMSLNPKFAWTGGYDYWTKKLLPIIQELRNNNNKTYKECLKILSQNLAVVELVPYHSKSFGLSMIKMNKLRSVSLMKDFVKNDLLNRAKNNKAIIIITRKSKYWDLPRHKNIIRYNNNEARSASLGLESKGGKIILQMLQ
ncbi:MAG TPA: hypothetical protein PKD03_04200 [Ignavibacteriaceae bacterium]|nr:hypothetical protein [Ignavibacteriaceae bacterium]